MNKILLGDNLEILKNIESESVDLIYLDPPFFSNRNYEVIWGDKGEVRSFQDRWSGGAEVMIDKIGKQTHAFKAVNYQVAVKVVDNEGIESIEIITLKTNSVLELEN